MPSELQIDVLRRFIAQLREFEERLEPILNDIDYPTESQIRRKVLTQDAAARLRRQIGHLCAEIELGQITEIFEAIRATRSDKKSGFKQTP